MARKGILERIDECGALLGGTRAYQLKDESDWSEYDRHCARSHASGLDPEDPWTRVRFAEEDSQRAVEAALQIIELRERLGLEKIVVHHPLVFGRTGEVIEENIEILRFVLDEIDTLNDAMRCGVLGQAGEKELLALLSVDDAETAKVKLSTIRARMSDRLQECLEAFAPLSLRCFVAAMDPIFRAFLPVHQYVADKLQRVYEGDQKRLAVSLPPGCGKSTLSSLYGTLWAMSRGREQVLMCSHSTTLAEAFSRKVRNAIDEDAYARCFPGVAVSADSRSVSQWANTILSELTAKGVTSSVSGIRCSLGVIDDPIPSRNAITPKLLADQAKWVSADFLPRLKSDGAMLLISTRWHQEDVCGFLERQQEEGSISGFEFVNIPLIAEPDDPLGRRVGEVLAPEIYTPERISEARNLNTPADFAALYLGKPTASDSTSGVQAEWIEAHRYSRVPEDEVIRRIVSVDSALTANARSDYSVFSCIAQTRDAYYVEGVWRGKLETLALGEKLCEFLAEHQATHCVVESAGSGLVLLQSLRPRGVMMERVPPQGTTKRIRYDSTLHLFRDGRVRFPAARDEHTDAMVVELLDFGGGSARYDDCVDSLCQGLLWLDRKAAPRKAKAVSLSSWLRGRKAA